MPNGDQYTLGLTVALGVNGEAQLAALEAELATFKARLGEMGTAFEGATLKAAALPAGLQASSQALGAVEGEAAKADGSIRNFVQGFSTTNFGGFNSGVNGAATSLEALGTTAGMVGLGIGALGLGLAAAAAQLGKAAADFDYDMTLIRNNTTMTDEDFTAMTNTIKTQSAATGASLNDLADGYRHAANLGFNMAESQQVVSAANELATATGAKVGETANRVAGIMKEFGISADDAGKAENTMFAIAAQGNMTFQELADFSGRLNAVTGALGGKLTDVGSAMDALTRHGFDAAQAQTQLLGIITHMVAPTSAATKELERLDQETGSTLVKDFSLAGLQTKGLAGIFDELRTAVGNNTAEVFKIIPAFRGGQGAVALLTTGTKDWNDSLKLLDATMAGEATPATAALGREMNTTEGKAKILGARFDLLKISLGEGISQAAGAAMGPLLGLGDGLTKAGEAANHAGLSFDQVKEVALNLMGPVGVLIESGSQLNDMWTTNETTARGLATLLGTEVHDALNTIQGDAEKLTQSLATELKPELDTVKGGFDQLKAAASPAWQEVANSGAASAAEGLMSQVAGSASALGAAFDALGQKARDAWAAVQDAAAAANAPAARLSGADTEALANSRDSYLAQHALDDQSQSYDTANSEATKFAQAQDAVSSASARVAQVVQSATTVATDSWNKYATMGVDAAKSAHAQLQSQQDRTQATMDQIHIKLTADTDAYGKNSESVQADNEALHQLEAQHAANATELSNVNARLEDFTKGAGGGGGASGAAKDLGNAVRDSNSALQDAQLQTKLAADAISLDYQPALDSLNASLHGLQGNMRGLQGELRHEEADYRHATQQLKSEYEPELDALKIKLADLEAQHTKTGKGASEANNALANSIKDVKGQISDLTEKEREQTEGLTSKYQPAIEATRNKIMDEQDTIANTTDAVTTLKDAHSAATDQLKQETLPTLDSLKVAHQVDKDALAKVEDQIKNHNRPATQDLTNLIQSSTTPQIQLLAQTLKDQLGVNLADLVPTLKLDSDGADKLTAALKAIPTDVNVNVTTHYNSTSGGGGGGGGGGAAAATDQGTGVPGGTPEQQALASQGFSGQSFGGFAVQAVGTPVPSFDLGGIVPGAAGEPLLAIVHGGETVIPPGIAAASAGGTGIGGGVTVVMNIDASSPWPVSSATAEAIGQQLEPLVTAAVIRAQRMGRLTLG